MLVFGLRRDEAVVGGNNRFGDIFSSEASSSGGVTGVKDKG